MGTLQRNFRQLMLLATKLNEYRSKFWLLSKSNTRISGQRAQWFCLTMGLTLVEDSSGVCVTCAFHFIAHRMETISCKIT